MRTVADLKKDRSCLKKDNHAKSEALFIPGNAGGSRLDARPVTAVLESLDGVSVSNRPAEVNGVFVDEQPRPQDVPRSRAEGGYAARLSLFMI